MQVTPRDLEILARVHAARVCDSAAMGDLFPSMGALWQRLWLLTRNHYLRAHRLGKRHGYSLGRQGTAVLGLPSAEVRVSRLAAIRYLYYADARRQLQAEGYTLNGQDSIARLTVLWAWREGRRVAVVVCDPSASGQQLTTLVFRLRSVVNPFAPSADQLLILGPVGASSKSAKVPPALSGRVVVRPLSRTP